MRGASWAVWLYLLLSAAAMAGVAAWVLRRALPAWNTSRTAIDGVEHHRSTIQPGPASARRLAFVVVDGLGWDHARDLETLAPLARDGVLRPMVASFPTYTAGGITAMFTGLSPRESGMRLNGAPTGPAGLDDVLASAWDGGVYVRVRARDYVPFLWLARSPPRADAKQGKLLVLADLVRWSFSPPPSTTAGGALEIEAIHFGEVDDAAHDHGTSSREFREAALHAGTILQTVAASLDPDRDVLIAVSDHGHRTSRGHGGVEPEVTRAFLLAWGHGVRQGAELGERPLRDVASTLAVVMGVHVPSSNMGVPMLDILDASDADKAKLLAEPFDELTRFDCEQMRAAPCEDVEPARQALEEGRIAEAEATMFALSAAIDDARERSASGATRTRLAAGVLIAIAVLLVASFRAPKFPNLVCVPLAAWTPYVVFLLAKGYGPTLSAMAPGSVFTTDSAQAVLVSLPAIAIVAGRHRLGLRDAVWLGSVTLSVIMIVLAWAGSDPRAISDPIAGALVFQLTPVALVAGMCGWLILAIDRWRPARASRPEIASARDAQ